MFICQGSFIRVYQFFSDLPSRSFLIVCYILYPDPYLQKKGQPPNMTENITFKQKETFFLYFNKSSSKNRSSHQVFCKKDFFKKLAIFTGKHMCWSLFLINLQGFRSATLLGRDSKAGVSFVKFAKFLRKLFWRTHGNDCFWKNRRPFYLGKCLSCYIIAESFVTPGVFL